TAGRPHLLAGDDVLVAVLDRLARETGEVGAGARLAEELAPRLATGDDLLDVELDLLRRAVVVDRRAGEQEAETTGRTERAEVADGLADGDALGAREALAVLVLGPRGRAPAGEAEALPPLADGEVGIPVLFEP